MHNQNLKIPEEFPEIFCLCQNPITRSQVFNKRCNNCSKLIFSKRDLGTRKKINNNRKPKESRSRTLSLPNFEGQTLSRSCSEPELRTENQTVIEHREVWLNQIRPNSDSSAIHQKAPDVTRGKYKQNNSLSEINPNPALNTQYLVPIEQQGSGPSGTEYPIYESIEKLGESQTNFEKSFSEDTPLIINGDNTRLLLRSYSQIYDEIEECDLGTGTVGDLSYLVNDNTLLNCWINKHPKRRSCPIPLGSYDNNENSRGSEILDDEAANSLNNLIHPNTPENKDLENFIENQNFGEMALNAIKTITSLGRFSGKEGEEVEKFFRQIERLFNQAQYNDERKAEILPFSLEKKALDFYDNLSEEQKNKEGTEDNIPKRGMFSSENAKNFLLEENGTQNF